MASLFSYAAILRRIWSSWTK